MFFFARKKRIKLEAWKYEKYISKSGIVKLLRKYYGENKNLENLVNKRKLRKDQINLILELDWNPDLP